MANSPNRLEWIFHTIVWIVMFIFPFLFIGRYSGTVSLRVFLHFLVSIAGSLAVFYVNYSYLVRRFLFTRRIWLFILINLLLYAVVFALSQLLYSLIPLHELLQRPGENLPPPGRGFRFYNIFLFMDFIKYVFLTVLSIALKATGSWYRMDSERKELEKQRSEAELQNLKNQLNPHFLFNTLNNIYSLIAINSEQAQEAVHELSRLLRYMLYDSSQAFVPLGNDIDFVRNYVELMRIRMAGHVDLKTEIQIHQPETLIAPLLFISLIENAFKHGISSSKPSFIRIEIIAGNNRIHCTVCNSFFPKDEQDKSGSGIGLINLKKRLDLLYPGNYKLDIEQKDETYRCELSLTL